MDLKRRRHGMDDSARWAHGSAQSPVGFKGSLRQPACPWNPERTADDDARFLPAVPYRADRIRDRGAGGRGPPGRRRAAAGAGDRDGAVCRGDGPGGGPDPLPAVLSCPGRAARCGAGCGCTGPSAHCPPRPLAVPAPDGRQPSGPCGRGDTSRDLESCASMAGPAAGHGRGDVRRPRGGDPRHRAAAGPRRTGPVRAGLLAAARSCSCPNLPPSCRCGSPGPCAVNPALPVDRVGRRLPTRRGPPELSPAA